MKTFIFLNLVVAGALVTGCAGGNNRLALDPVGPGNTPATGPDPASGALVVYSAIEANADFYSPNPYLPTYSNYRILSADGKLLEKVHNDSDDSSQSPVAVKLPVGNYQIVAQVNGYGDQTIPVVIEARKKTVLHLEGSGNWPYKYDFNATNAVRLPDGRNIGWRAAVTP